MILTVAEIEQQIKFLSLMVKNCTEPILSYEDTVGERCVYCEETYWYPQLYHRDGEIEHKASCEVEEAKVRIGAWQKLLPVVQEDELAEEE